MPTMPFSSVSFDVTTPEGLTNARRWLAGHRKRVGLTQLEVARRMGTTADVVSNFETGRTNVRLSTLQRYVRALELTPAVGVQEAS